MAVLAVVLTAPLGALATNLLGPVMLKKYDGPPDGKGPEENHFQPPEDRLHPTENNNHNPPEEPEFSGKAGSYEGAD